MFAVITFVVGLTLGVIFKDRIVSVIHALKNDITSALAKAAPTPAAPVATAPSVAVTPSTAVPTKA